MQKNSSVSYWQRALQEFRHIRSLTGSGLLAALGIVLRALALPITATLRVSFYFLAIGMSGFLYGPLIAGFTGVVVDTIGFLYNPGGAYFFGFTLNAFLTGFIMGLWLYRRPVKLWRSAAAIATNSLLVNILLNSLWLSILTQAPLAALMFSRVPKNILLFPLETGLLLLFLKLGEKQKKYLVHQ